MNQISPEDMTALFNSAKSRIDPKALKALEILSTKLPGLSAYKEMLSAVPAHPYIQLKEELLGKNYKPTTFKDIEAPEDFNLQNCIDTISEMQNKIHQTATERLSAMTSGVMSGIANGMVSQNLKNFDTYFSTLSGNEYIMDKNRAGKFVGFLETIRTMSEDDIRVSPITTAQKLLTQYIKVMQDSV